MTTSTSGTLAANAQTDGKQKSNRGGRKTIFDRKGNLVECQREMLARCHPDRHRYYCDDERVTAAICKGLYGRVCPFVRLSSRVFWSLRMDIFRELTPKGSTRKVEACRAIAADREKYLLETVSLVPRSLRLYCLASWQSLNGTPVYITCHICFLEKSTERRVNSQTSGTQCSDCLSLSDHFRSKRTQNFT